MVIVRSMVGGLTFMMLGISQICAMQGDGNSGINRLSDTFDQRSVANDFSARLQHITMEYQCTNPDEVLKVIKRLIEAKSEKSAEEYVVLLQDYLKEQGKTLCDIKYEGGQTLLHRALVLGYTKTFSLILKVAALDNVGLLELLKQLSYDMNDDGKKAFTTILGWAAYNRQNDIVCEIIKIAGNQIDEIFKVFAVNGANPLQLAIQRGNYSVVTTFLEMAGENVWKWIVAPSSSGSNALYYAAANGELDIAKLLVDAVGGRAYELITMPRDNGNTSLDTAIAGLHPLVWAYLKGICLKYETQESLSYLLPNLGKKVSYN